MTGSEDMGRYVGDPLGFLLSGIEDEDVRGAFECAYNIEQRMRNCVASSTNEGNLILDPIWGAQDLINIQIARLSNHVNRITRRNQLMAMLNGIGLESREEG